ncbi:MAG: Hsp20/alpha crystallin family protein [Verrucomicrobiota bacterium]
MKTQITNWDPFQEWNEIQNRLSSLIHRSNDAVPAATADWAPAVGIVEDENEFRITADLPDVKKEDVNIEVHDEVLTLSGERRHEVEEKDEKKKFHRVERSYRKYVRSFRLPEGVDADNVAAKYDAGVLNVTLPKVEAKQPEPKRISVN